MTPDFRLSLEAWPGHRPLFPIGMLHVMLLTYIGLPFLEVYFIICIIHNNKMDMKTYQKYKGTFTKQILIKYFKPRILKV